MEAEIKAIIEKSLPAQVGEVLKKRLEQADDDVNRIKELEEQLSLRNTHINRLESQISDYKKYDERNLALSARESACDVKERDLNVKTLEYQLQAEKEKTKFTQDVALGLVRNTNYRESIYNTESPGVFTDSQGRWRQQSPSNKSSNITKTED